MATIDESAVASVSSALGACSAACRFTVSDAPCLGLGLGWVSDAPWLGLGLGWVSDALAPCHV